MEERREERITCGDCHRELKDDTWVIICNCCDGTYCAPCARKAAIMRGFKTRAAYIQRLFRRWLDGKSVD